MASERPSPEPTAAHPTLGKYQVLATLGSGGMAEVYLAALRGPAGFLKLVVLKRPLPDLIEAQECRDMFLDEARVAGRLNHPNVVSTFEVVDDGPLIFTAMEYLDGQPLNVLMRDLLAQELVLDAALSARIMADVLAGLHYAHEIRDFRGAPLNVVHRDVSPQNIFLTYAGQVKVVDFGIAKAEARRAQTEVGVLKGKVAYMAPEQAVGDPIDRRADVFAAGIVLWEMLTGHRLMAKGSSVATLYHLLNEKVAPPSELMANPDEELDAIVLRALERDPSRRYQTANEMRHALEAYLQKHPATNDDIAARMRSMYSDTRARFQAELHGLLEGGPSRAKSPETAQAAAPVAAPPRREDATANAVPAKPRAERSTSSPVLSWTQPGNATPVPSRAPSTSSPARPLMRSTSRPNIATARPSSGSRVGLRERRSRGRSATLAKIATGVMATSAVAILLLRGPSRGIVARPESSVVEGAAMVRAVAPTSSHDVTSPVTTEAVAVATKVSPAKHHGLGKDKDKDKDKTLAKNNAKSVSSSTPPPAAAEEAGTGRVAVIDDEMVRPSHESHDMSDVGSRIASERAPEQRPPNDPMLILNKDGSVNHVLIKRSLANAR